MIFGGNSLYKSVYSYICLTFSVIKSIKESAPDCIINVVTLVQSPGGSLSLGDSWQCQETFWVVTSKDGDVCYCHLMGTDQGHC